MDGQAHRRLSSVLGVTVQSFIRYLSVTSADCAALRCTSVGDGQGVNTTMPAHALVRCGTSAVKAVKVDSRIVELFSSAKAPASNGSANSILDLGR